MPRRRKEDNYNAYIDAALQSLVCSLILGEENSTGGCLDPDDSEFKPVGNGRQDYDDSDFVEPDATTLSELLEIAAIDWMSIAASFYSSGPGSRGPYDRIPKSVDFFSCCLQAPDREFRHMFRCVILSDSFPCSGI